MLKNSKKQIILLETSPTDMLAKISYTLKKRGYETALISIIGNVDTDFLRKSYDRRINFDFKYFKINFKNLHKIVGYGLKKFSMGAKAFFAIKKLKPYIVIGRSNPSWILVLFKTIFFRKYPFVYFPYDIRSSLYKDTNQIKKAGVPDFEIKSERFCFENSDGIMHKGAKNELEHLNEKILKKRIKINCPKIYFFPYCLKELMVPVTIENKLSKKDKQIHLVYAGTIVISEEWIKTINMIISPKIHLHFYGKTANLSKEEYYGRIKKQYTNLLNHKFFHLHSSTNQMNLSKELSKYDLGIFGLGEKEQYQKDSTGNKISSYLEAGIPIFNLKHYEVIAKLVKKYKIGINMNFSEITNLQKILKKQNTQDMLNNIKKAREELSMGKNMPRLERFFKEVINHKQKRLKIK